MQMRFWIHKNQTVMFWTRIVLTQCCLQILIKTSTCSSEVMEESIPQSKTDETLGFPEVESDERTLDAGNTDDNNFLDQDSLVRYDSSHLSDSSASSTSDTSSSPSNPSSPTDAPALCGCSSTNRQTKDVSPSDKDTCSLDDEVQPKSHLYDESSNKKNNDENNSNVKTDGKYIENLANEDSVPADSDSDSTSSSSPSSSQSSISSSPSSSSTPSSSSSSSSTPSSSSHSSSTPSSSTPSSNFRDHKRAMSALKTLNSMRCLVAGKFRMGTDRPVFLADGESPARTISVSPFCLDSQVSAWRCQWGFVFRACTVGRRLLGIFCCTLIVGRCLCGVVCGTLMD